jgi:hypothetical protein
MHRLVLCTYATRFYREMRLVCHLPFFPPRCQLLGFFMDVSDRVEKEKADSPLVLALEENAQHIVGLDWRQNIGRFWCGGRSFCSSRSSQTRTDTLVLLGDQLLEDLNRFRRYNWSSVVDLLRAARNKVCRILRRCLHPPCVACICCCCTNKAHPMSTPETPLHGAP